MYFKRKISNEWVDWPIVLLPGVVAWEANMDCSAYFSRKIKKISNPWVD